MTVWFKADFFDWRARRGHVLTDAIYIMIANLPVMYVFLLIFVPPVSELYFTTLTKHKRNNDASQTLQK